MMAAFSVGSVPTCDLSLHGLSLRERQAMMTQADWGLLVDRELWEHMTPTERERARAEWDSRPTVVSGRHVASSGSPVDPETKERNDDHGI